MSPRGFPRTLFLAAAVYDGLIGAIFCFAPGWPYHQFSIAEPNHPAYVQFPGALLIIFAAMFVRISRAPGQYRHLIPYGIALKAAYCAIAFYYWMLTGIPELWKAFAIIDLATGICFAWVYFQEA